MAEPQSKRGGCLTAFLVLMAVGSPLMIAYYLHGELVHPELWVTVPRWEVAVRVAMSCGNLVFAGAMWFRRRWGVVGFAAVPVVSLLIVIHVFDPSWYTTRGYPLWGFGPLVSLTTGLLAILLYILFIQRVLTRGVWQRGDTVEAVIAGIPALILSAVPGLSVWPLNLTSVEGPVTGLLGGMLLALLARPLWREGR